MILKENLLFLHRTRRNPSRGPVVLLLLAGAVLGFVLPARADPTPTRPSEQTEWGRFLPADSKIADPRRDIILADVTGDSKEDVVIFYSRETRKEGRKPAIIVLQKKGSTYERLWEVAFDVGWGFLPPSGVRDLTKSGFGQIIAYRSVGGSCYGQVDIYDYQRLEFRRISGWGEGTCEASVELKDLNSDGTSEIILTTKSYGTNPDIYRWDGRLFTLSNALFPRFYYHKVQELAEVIYSREPLPLQARLMATDQAFDIFLIQKRYSEAVQLCQAVLRMVDDSQLTTSNTIPTGNETAENLVLARQSFLREKRQAKAGLHRLMAKAYLAAGKGKLAEDELERVKELETEDFH